MNRTEMIDQAKDSGIVWDLIVIGGGATGLGTAVDAASRGYRTALLEKHDFGNATSSRSTKMAHGGVRYLRRGEFSLVREALREREHLLISATHVVRRQPFLIPTYSWFQAPFYYAGLKLYDALAGRHSFGRASWMSKNATLGAAPTLDRYGLKGSIRYFDGQFDDSRLIVSLALTAAENGCALMNYVGAESIMKDSRGVAVGVEARDQRSGSVFEMRTKAIVNASGIFVDTVRAIDDASSNPILTFSRGTHLILDRSVLPGDDALLIPETSDGRVLFLIPWHDVVLLGTTDVAALSPEHDPSPTGAEIDYLLDHASAYLTSPVGNGQIRSAFAGLRPLVRSRRGGNTSALSRDHLVEVSRSGMITVTGGKWTTYRSMAESAVNAAARFAILPHAECKTYGVKLHGWSDERREDGLNEYGTDAKAIEQLNPELQRRIHANLPVSHAQIVWAGRHEMAQTLEDALSRRTRALLLDARASIEAAPVVASILARELGRDATWEREQVGFFTRSAQKYVPS